MIGLSKEEVAAIRTLERLAKRWPKTLWLFSGSGILNVMRLGPDGEPVMTGLDGYDPDFSLATIDIPNDGGDW